jgi:polyhydroxyalkanoate synthesis regulator phasin
MALETLRGYLALAGGLTEVTRAKALAQAKALLNEDTLTPVVAGGVRAQAQVQALADELVAAGRANRELLKGLVRAEVERVVGGLGVAGRDELDALRASVDRMERRIAVLESAAAAASAVARQGGRASGAPATRAPAKKSTAKKSTAKKASPKKSSAKKSTAKRNPTGSGA